jgi:hypothetical protein
VPHALPQLPQLAGSIQPSTQLPPHRISPGFGQGVGMPHWPWVHSRPVHAVPHAPQLLPSFCVSVHVEPHIVKPALHFTEHVPA